MTPQGEAALDAIGNANHEPYCIDLNWSNLRTVLHNSRLFLCLANRARLARPDDEELASCFALLQEEHRRLRWVFVLSTIERLFATLTVNIFPVYSAVLLHRYGVELGYLRIISEDYDGSGASAIKAVL